MYLRDTLPLANEMRDIYSIKLKREHKTFTKKETVTSYLVGAILHLSRLN